jgi:hypothetical protein
MVSSIVPDNLDSLLEYSRILSSLNADRLHYSSPPSNTSDRDLAFKQSNGQGRSIIKEKQVSELLVCTVLSTLYKEHQRQKIIRIILLLRLHGPLKVNTCQAENLLNMAKKIEQHSQSPLSLTQTKGEKKSTKPQSYSVRCVV